MATKLKIEGVLHPFNVQLLKKRTLHKKFKERPDTELHGLFDPRNNTIYVASDLPPEMRMHVFLHELSHALYHMISRLDEESTCDVIGAYLEKLLRPKTLEELLKQLEVK